MTDDLDDDDDLDHDELPYWQYPPDWDERRRAVFRRDDFTCQKCGARSGLQCHHLESGPSRSHAIDKLITLCESCHEDVHPHMQLKQAEFFPDATDDQTFEFENRKYSIRGGMLYDENNMFVCVAETQRIAMARRQSAPKAAPAKPLVAPTSPVIKPKPTESTAASNGGGCLNCLVSIAVLVVCTIMLGWLRH